jgi:hypothetical protein
LLLLLGSIVPSVASGARRTGGIILGGEVEVVSVFVVLLFVLGLLVIIQECSGLT